MTLAPPAAAAVKAAAAKPVEAKHSPAAEARLKALYSVMQSIENRLGGGEGVEGLYGSIKKSGMDRVLACLEQRCGLGADSVLVDVGAGLGRPLMHALLEPGVAGARGIEIDRIKCDKAAAFLRQAVAELQRRGLACDGLAPPPVECAAIEDVRTLDPCTHAYSFWEGVPVEGKAAFGRLFAASRTMRSVAVVQRAIRTDPAAYMADLGFGELALAGCFPVSMSGSGRSFTAYCFVKAQLPAPLPAPLVAEEAAAQSVQTPAQAAEALAAASLGDVAPAAEVDGEVAQSRPTAAAAAVGRGRRTRRPSAKQAAAQEAAAQQGRSARELRADRRAAAVWEAAKAPQAEYQQQQQSAAAAPAPAAAPAQQQPAAQAEGSGAAARGRRSTSCPVASSDAASKPAAKLSSPAKGGVQKRASPAKSATSAASAAAVPRRTSPRKAAAVLAEAAAAGTKGGATAAAAPGGVLSAAARVVKAGLAGAAGALRRSPRKQAAAAVAAAGAPARRGLQDRLASA